MQNTAVLRQKDAIFMSQRVSSLTTLMFFHASNSEQKPDDRVQPIHKRFNFDG